MILGRDIDRLSDVPVWMQVYDALRAGILDGTWPPRTALPSARDIQEQTGIARGTVAKAFDRLKEQGAVRFVPGRGPFVTPRDEWRFPAK